MPFAVENASRIRANAAAGLLGALAWLWGVAAALGASARHPATRHVSARTEVGRASYYGSRHAGKITASGTRFSPDRLTAASPSLPLGTRAKVTNLRNGRSVDVTVTDRGPVVRHRILDVSRQAADRLGMRKAGVTTVKIQPIAEPKAAR
jgi:rare lipoprotein A